MWDLALCRYVNHQSTATGDLSVAQVSKTNAIFYFKVLFEKVQDRSNT